MLTPWQAGARPACGRQALRPGAAGSQDESPCRAIHKQRPYRVLVSAAWLTRARHAVPLRMRIEMVRLQLHGEVNDRSYGYACGAFCQPRSSFIYPAGGGYVEVDPGGVFCEFFYEPGAGDGAAAFA